MSDDLISRQAAITLPVMPKEYREYQTFNLDDAYEQGWNDLQKCIELLPSEEPETKLIAVIKMFKADVQSAVNEAAERIKAESERKKVVRE